MAAMRFSKSTPLSMAPKHFVAGAEDAFEELEFFGQQFVKRAGRRRFCG